MREILFRGKRYDNLEWVEGYLLKECNYLTCSWNLGIEYKTDKFGKFAYDVAEIIPYTVGQFTGLTDKNGKKIFDGDIGKYKQTDGAKRNGKLITCIGKVVYNEKTASFAVDSKDDAGCKYFDYFPIKDFEVIGNIHDNPELLEVEKNG